MRRATIAGRVRAILVLVAIAGGLITASPAGAARDIPIGVYNLNGARSQDGPNRIWAMRLVLDRDASVQRIFTGFNMEGIYTDPANRPAPIELRSKVLSKGYGAPPAPSNLPSGWTPGTGRIDYGHGNGGRLRARLVPMRADGTPDLARVLAEDTFYPVERYKQTKAEFAIGDRAGMVYANFSGAQLKRGTPYWVIYQNVDPNPTMNYVSFNSPTVTASQSGPNGRNTLDPNASGAILGLDPREVVAWSWDTGTSWRWGREVGGGGPWISGDYIGSTTSDDGTRLPWYAWQETGETRLRSNQPYMSYPDGSSPGRYTVRVLASPRATVLTEGGGFAPIGSNVGVVTVRNTRTGKIGRTASLGSGIVRGRLDQTVPVAIGDTYEITNSGVVWKAQGDNFLLSMGLVGSAVTRQETVGQGNDRAELFAAPHVYENTAVAPVPASPPAPAPTPAPAPAPTATPVPAAAPTATPAPTRKPRHRKPRAAVTRSVASAGCTAGPSRSQAAARRCVAQKTCARAVRVSRLPTASRRLVRTLQRRCTAARRTAKRSATQGARS